MTESHTDDTDTVLLSNKLIVIKTNGEGRARNNYPIDMKIASAKTRGKC